MPEARNSVITMECDWCGADIAAINFAQPDADVVDDCHIAYYLHLCQRHGLTSPAAREAIAAIGTINVRALRAATEQE